MPPLKVEEAKKLTEIRPAVVHTKVKYLKDGSEHPLQKQDFYIYLMARNVIRWAVPDVAKGSGFIPLLEHIAAWVTPHAKPVKDMLREAADYNPKMAMWGYPKSPDPQVAKMQVKAIYLALREKAKIAYVDSTFAIGSKNGERRQAVRLPSESLSERSVNCIDGAVLYASLIEAEAHFPDRQALAFHETDSLEAINFNSSSSLLSQVDQERSPIGALRRIK